MKIRSDYVSNSSSASFIIKKDAAKAAKMFLDDFAESLVDSYELLGETFEIGVRMKRSTDNLYWLDYMKPEQFAVQFTTGDEGDEDGYGKVEKKNPEDIEELGFECDDWDKGSMAYLAFILKYFKKFGFETDSSDSERGINDTDSFLGKILDKLEVKTHEDKK